VPERRDARSYGACGAPKHHTTRGLRGCDVDVEHHPADVSPCATHRCDRVVAEQMVPRTFAVTPSAGCARRRHRTAELRRVCDASGLASSVDRASRRLADGRLRVMTLRCSSKTRPTRGARMECLFGSRFPRRPPSVSASRFVLSAEKLPAEVHVEVFPKQGGPCCRRSR